MAIFCSLLWTLDEAYAKFTFLVTLDRKKFKLYLLVSQVKQKCFIFYIPISTIAGKLCGKGEQFGDKTLQRRQIFVWKTYCSLYVVDLLSQLTFPYCISSILIPVSTFVFLYCEAVKHKYQLVRHWNKICSAVSEQGSLACQTVCFHFSLFSLNLSSSTEILSNESFVVINIKARLVGALGNLL